MKKVLVTGATGFVGAYVVEHLRENANIEVDELGKGFLTGLRLGQQTPMLQALMSMPKYECVVNIAAYIGNSPVEITNSNFHGIHDVLDYCNYTGARLIHISRSFVSKLPNEQIKSSRLDRLYVYSKKYAEQLIYTESRVQAAILAITAPVWPTMPRSRFLSQIIISIIEKKPIFIYGEGRRIQNYVRLDDIAEVISHLIMQTENEKVKRIQLAGPENFSDFDFAKTIYERLGVNFNFILNCEDANAIVDVHDYSINQAINYTESNCLAPRKIDYILLKEHMNYILKQKST